MSNIRNPPYDACLYGITTFQCNLDCNYCISEFVRNLVMCDEPSELHIKTIFVIDFFMGFIFFIFVSSTNINYKFVFKNIHCQTFLRV